eukprot:TRINITY_DN110707_c0_g1_i1.p1 TRINITY_DN110707_c0_g1~~TRINITY_DN110707_c0_g1_i1.p1  ORF type:complete len:162 (-),score=27.42 TRINITY_DN110707_c0_g1_i1:114-599(-)
MFRAEVVLAVALAFSQAAALTLREPSTPSDVAISVTKAGDGKTIPSKGLMVRLHYTGTIAGTGKVIDSSRVEGGEPFQFRMGAGKVIPCYEHALVHMSMGERATIHCPADLAYGEDGVPGTVPPNAKLDFDIEILSVFSKPLSLFEQLKAKYIAQENARGA